VLLLAALADGKTRIENLLDSDDTGVMLNALELLGVRIERDSATVRGGRSRTSPPTFTWQCRHGLPAAYRRPRARRASTGSRAARMHERPIGDLVDACERSARASTISQRRLSAACLAPGAIRRGAPVRVRGDVPRSISRRC